MFLSAQALILQNVLCLRAFEVVGMVEVLKHLAATKRNAIGWEMEHISGAMGFDPNELFTRDGECDGTWNDMLCFALIHSGIAETSGKENNKLILKTEDL